jgi:hypothetical protein
MKDVQAHLSVKRALSITLGAMPLIMASPVLAEPGAAIDPVRVLVKRLDLERYKATIKSLTQFGDRRQGTARNRAAIDWIEAQLKSYGCTNTERLKYMFGEEPVHRVAPAKAAVAIGSDEPGLSVGGGRSRGFTSKTGVNSDPNAQSDARIRALDTPPAVPGPREEVYCTKIGTGHPDEMYIVSAHMDGIGFGEAANDDGSGTALVMELARVFSSGDVITDRSIRFILWNNEETVSCPRLSGPSTMIVWTTKGTTNAEQEAQAGGDHRQAA